MIKKAIICSMFFVVAGVCTIYGKSEKGVTTIQTIEKGVTLYELDETGQQFIVCGKGKSLVFIDNKPLTELQPINDPNIVIGDPTEEKPTEEKPTEEATDEEATDEEPSARVY